MGSKPRTIRPSFSGGVFADFDLSGFWRESEYAKEKYEEAPVSKAQIASVETELGVRLPRAYLDLMRHQNGGIPNNQCIPTDTSTSWAEDHAALSGIFGVGYDKRYALCGVAGSRFWQEEWGYPNIGICIGTCPSGGHDMIMLDYRECGRDGEPQVVHVSQDCDFEITVLAANFETFVRSLVNESVYDTSAEDLLSDMGRIEKGSFSKLLSGLLADFDGPNLAPVLRNLCKKLTAEKGYFALHADKLSFLVYDILFLLYSATNRVPHRQAYLQKYPDMLALGDGEFTTGGYAPNFVDAWMKRREKRGEIIMTSSGSLRFTDDSRAALIRRAQPYLD